MFEMIINVQNRERNEMYRSYNKICTKTYEKDWISGKCNLLFRTETEVECMTLNDQICTTINEQVCQNAFEQVNNKW